LNNIHHNEKCHYKPIYRFNYFGNCFFISKDKTETANYGLPFAAFALIFIVPLMKFLFPVTRELKIETPEFYLNLIHKTAEFLKKKRKQ
jgi:hypothetical protein